MIHAVATLAILCVFLQVFQYVLYPAGVILVAALRGPRVLAPLEEGGKKVSLIICAFNEEGVIAQKLENSLALDPPPDEIIVVDDGSQDATAAIAATFEHSQVPVRVLTGAPRAGKSAAMNRGAEVSRHEIIVFSDATEMYETRALKFLLAEFADPSVAVVSGAHRVRPQETGDGSDLTGRSEGLYWRYEEMIRKAESDLGATVASVGAILAIRREDWRPLPKGTINDDAWIAMSNLARGRNVRFARRAVSWEQANVSVGQEAARRLRISAGRLVLLSQAGIWPWRRPWVLFAFLSHKVLRLGLPLLLLLSTVSSALVVLLKPDWTFFWVLLALHVLFFVLAFAGFVAEQTNRRWRIAHLAYHVWATNLAGLKAYFDLLRRRSFLMWEKPSR